MEICFDFVWVVLIVLCYGGIMRRRRGQREGEINDKVSPNPGSLCRQ